MLMEFFFQLHDQDGIVHNKFQSKFDDESTLDGLREKIHSKWAIPTEEQQLFFEDGRELIGRGANNLKFFGLKDCDKVIVKHSLLSSWSAVIEREAAFQQTNEIELKKSIHADANGLIESLVNSRFFLSYPTFGTRRFAIQKKFLTFFDRKVESIKNSCRSYFTKIHGPNVKLTFASRLEGSRSGCVCIVEDKSATIKYYVKTHHGAGDKSSNTRYDLDLKELFVYKFLEHLKMGAEIQFIDNESFSRWIIYIGSREIPGFKTLEAVFSAEPQNVNEYSKYVVQMLCVYSVLMLGDHHIANMGVDSTRNPFVVDFFIIGRALTSVKDLYEKVRMAEQFTLNLGTFDERLQISLDYLRDSNFLAVLESTVDSFLREQKPLFDKSLLFFDAPQKTNDLKEYVTNVRRNVELFINSSN